MTALLFGDLLTIFIETHLELGIAGSIMMQIPKDKFN